MSPAPLRVVALDHFFDQDLRELEAHPRLVVRRIPFTRLRDRAIALLGSDAAVGLESVMRSELSAARGQYAAWLVDEIERIYLEWPFEAFVLPSDTFFYVRDLPDATHRLGVPTVVVQKETTVSPAAREMHARDVGHLAPPVADAMTVCSQAQLDFWLRAGATASAIAVTGQPRFDAYARARSRWRPRGVRRVLFFSYELDAYEPGVGRGLGRHTWAPLRTATERALLELARQGRVEVTVKHHPQQSMDDEVTRLRGMAGDLWGRGWSVADPLVDTRELITSADVVVGFQTTAMFEALAAGRPTIYAAWGEAFERHRDGLIPLHATPGIRHAISPDRLTDLVLRATPSAVAPDAYERDLGPVDGRATERVVEVLEDVCSSFSLTSRADDLRAASRRRRDALSRIVPVACREVGLSLLVPVGRYLGRHRGVSFRLAAARDVRRHLVRNLRPRDGAADTGS